MRRALAIAALLVATSQYATTAEAASRRSSKAKPAAGAAADPKVTALVKAILRAEPSEIGKPLGKLRAKERLVFVERSEDGAWVQVRRGKLAGWVKAEELDGVPETAVATTDKPPAATPDKPVAKGPAGAGPTPVPAARPVEVPAEKPAVATVPAVADPVAPIEPVVQAPPVAGRPLARPPLSGLWFSVGGGFALLGSSFTSAFKSGLNPDLFNYDGSSLPAIGAQARLGYTFGYRWLRVGVDAGYRFSGGSQIVVKLAERDSEPVPVVNPSGGTVTLSSTVLPAQRQTLNTMAHDVDAALSVGGYMALGRRLDLSLRARGGVQLQALVPEFNPNAALPQELFYGPQVGAVVELQSRAIPGFGLRLDGAYLPYGVRQENSGLRDSVSAAMPSAECAAADAKPERCQGNPRSTGFSLGGSAAMRVVPGFDVEIGYRLLSTETTYAPDSISERLSYNRDNQIKARASQERFLSASRSTSQQLIFIGVAFRQ